ncbi:MAG TPA: choice-of-anchor D domain-containing protein [Actinocrinis sp.]|nr:choice-of-anchor D domain-containing protein [Actinocrinis sp.]
MNSSAPRTPRASASLCLAALLCACAVSTAASIEPAQADETTVSQDTYRTGWDQAEPGLSPAAVTSSDFGHQFSTALNGQVYAQPLLADGTLIAATENNDVYGLDPATGAILWTDSLGPAWPASAIDCGDLTPDIGVTSAPVYDPASGYVYLTAKVNDGPDQDHPHWYMNAVSPTTGAEKPGFPVAIAGSPSNDPTVTFDPKHEMQRPGLLLLGGVVYAAFGSHCDFGPYRGYVVGVSTGGVQTAMWASQVGAANNGGGIWAAGGGLVSDGPGRIIFATGNGVSPAAVPGTSPPGNLSESVVRLQVNPNGSLSTADFFSPSDAPIMDANDTDLGSGGPMALPDSFGTAADPHLMVQMGKDGRLFLLNRDNLGGHDQGPGGTDAVLGTLGPYQGQWGHPAFWGGDGGYVYIVGNGGPLRAFKYGVSGSGAPALTMAGTSATNFSYTSGSPVVTSTGSTSGSAVVWVVESTGPGGQDSELCAYSPVPDANGTLDLLWSGAIGTGVKFTTPATDNGRVYVGTRDGDILAFGRPSTTALSGSPVTIGNVAVGSTGTGTLTLTATKALNITAVSTSAPFAVTAPTLPHALAAGASVSVPVAFSPAATGATSGIVTIATDTGGTINFTATGTGVQDGLSADPGDVTFDQEPVGLATTTNVQITNTGTGTEKVSAVSAPGAPYTVSGLPAVGTAIPAGGSFIASVVYDPAAPGTNDGTITVTSTSGTLAIPVSGTAVSGEGDLVIAPAAVSFGTVPIGSSSTLTFTVTNTGNIPVTITKAKAPDDDFTSSAPLAEGLVIGPGQTQTQSVTFTPTSPGYQSANYEITGSAGQGAMYEPLTGNASGALPTPPTDWQTNGSATQSGGAIQLTPASASAAGSAFFAHPVPTTGLTASFTAQLNGGTGGDGLSFALVDPTRGSASGVGASGGGLGFSGLPGLSVDLVTSWNSQANSGNFVGIAAGPGNGADALTYLATAVVPTSLRTGTHAVTVTVNTGVITVLVDGTRLLSYTPAAGVIPATAYAGFTGATGASTDLHTVSGLAITTAAPPAGGQPLTAAPAAIAFGTAPEFSTLTQDVTLTNDGPATETVTATAEPSGAFTAALPAVGLQLPPGGSTTVPVGFRPVAAGTSTGTFSVTTTDGTVAVTLAGTGQADAPAGAALPAPADPSWVRNGQAALSGTGLVLTAAGGGYGSGSSFYPLPVPSAGLTATFTTRIGGGSGGDGLSFALLDPTQNADTALGNPGAGLGFSGLGGVAVGEVTSWSSAVGSGNFVGISTSAPGATGDAAFTATDTSLPNLRTGTHTFTVTYTTAGVLVVTMDGTQILSKAVSLPPNVLVGFTGANGGSDDDHTVTAASITAGREPLHSLPAFTDASWTLNGSAADSSGTVALTTDGQNYTAGSIVNDIPVDPIGLHISFTEQTAGTATVTGDGMTLALLDASKNTPTALGANGGGLGVAGLGSTFLGLCTYPDMGVNSYGFAAVGTSAAGSNALTTLGSSVAIPGLQGSTHTIDITITSASDIVVLVDGATSLDVPVTLPDKVLIAFTAGVGASTDTHAVSAPTITYLS